MTGIPVGLAELDTPSLLIYQGILEHNIRRMSNVAQHMGVKLRPHIKTHKNPVIARLQVAAGARGVTCATLKEVEVMAEGGIDDILIAFPPVGEAKLRRLASVLRRAKVIVAVDSLEVAAGLAAVGREIGTPIALMLEVDTGMHRCGLPVGDELVRVALAISELQGVALTGLLSYGGQVHSGRTTDEQAEIGRAEGITLVQAQQLLNRNGVAVWELSAGSTLGALGAASVPGITEIRPGTYALNDARRVAFGWCTPDDCALRILATVVSTPPGRVVLDAGTKVMTGDPLPFGAPGHGLLRGFPDVRIHRLSEEHGVIDQSAETLGLRIGDRVQVIPNHACVVSNLFDRVYMTDGERVLYQLPIPARQWDL
jgi:D-serine deaminase-like pyridoxal phosphate-dependent protein